MTMSGDDLVYLTFGVDYEDGELRRRGDLPAYAVRAGYDLDGSGFDGGDPNTGPRMYDCYAIANDRGSGQPS
jgi:hypothetical protein